MSVNFVPGLEPPGEQVGLAWWLAFQEGRLLVRSGEDGVAELPCLVDLGEVGLAPVRSQYIGLLGGLHCYAAEIDGSAAAPPDLAFEALRGLFSRLDEEIYALAGRAIQLVEWDRTHQYCGQCGAQTGSLPGERAKKCPHCGLVSFPRLSPAVIVRVRRGDEILLARSHNFPAAFYSVLAGFVEPGESLEETIMREVKEEVGVEVNEIRYFGSQPWPFPHSLMIAFTANYAGGEIEVDGREIADARWFSRDNMPEIPGKLSIARWLIDSFLAED